jgi:enterochelin esterase-like enzyme
VETFRQFPIYYPELIDYIDAHYKTIADREHRAISGLSMGGFMTFWISGKYPDLFTAAVIFAAPLNLKSARKTSPLNTATLICTKTMVQ